MRIKNTLSLKIGLLLSGSLLIVMLVWGGVTYLLQKSEIDAEYKRSIEGVVKRLSLTIPEPFWNTNNERVENFLDMEMADENIVALIIKDSEGHFVHRDNNDPESPLILKLKNTELKLIPYDGAEFDKSRKLVTYTETINLEYNEDFLGTLEIYASNTIMQKKLSSLAIQLAVQFIIISILIFLIIFLSFRILIFNNFESFISFFNIVTEGDLTHTLKLKTKDEIGELSGQLNSFIFSLKEAVNHIKESTENAASLSSTLSSSQKDFAEALEQIKQNIENVNMKTHSLDEEISQSDRISQDISNASETVRDKLTDQSREADKSSTDIQVMVDNVINVTEITKKQKQTIDDLVSSVISSQKEMEDTINVIQKMADSTEVVMEAAAMINNIAGKLDTLAINAAIEAAQAGQAGKGFTVVAEEIRSMAEDTVQNSKQITESLNEMIENIQVSQKSSLVTGDYLNNIISGIKQVMEGISRIEQIMISLSNKGREILSTFFSLMNSTGFVRKASQDMIEKMENNYLILKNVKKVSAETDSGMMKIYSLIKEIYAAIKVLDEASIENQENINVIRNLVNRFKS
ncbi:MAG: HAMP domain-containing protein [Spirochaetales bacterium]|nr:HAMP domain-containing protein [Spirochaetales bacterium]